MYLSAPGTSAGRLIPLGALSGGRPQPVPASVPLSPKEDLDHGYS
jgi:hypothetical protein